MGLNPPRNLLLNYAKASLPTAGVEGRLAAVNDTLGGVWMDTGVQWIGINGEKANVKDAPYGAKGDGVTDDTTAIQTAINNVSTAGGGVVYLPNGTYLHGGLTLQNRVWLVGQHWFSTILKLKNAANVSSIINHVSTNGTTDPNAMHCAVMNLYIDGNKANQTGTSHGIFLNVNPTWTQASGDDNFDSNFIIQNLWIKNTHDDGFQQLGRASTYIANVYALYCGGNGFTPSADTIITQCNVGQSGLAGFNITGPNVHLSNCMSYYSGQVTAGSGHGYHLNNNGEGNITLVGCDAQDNKAAGFSIDTAARVSLVGCTADSNSTSGAGSYPGFDFWNSNYCVVRGCLAIERKADNVNSYQTHALRMRQATNANNIVEIIFSGTNGAVLSTAIDSGSNALAGNTIIINNEAGGQQTGTFAASYTPDPYNGSVINMTLTNNITINAPANGHIGSTLTFVLTQDATGGRTMTFNAVYKTSWTPSTTASKTNVISFWYDGTNWYQTYTATGL